MKNWQYHLVFWLIYLSYTTLTVYMIDRHDFVFPLTVIDIFLGNFFTSVLPFYIFYQLIFIFATKKQYWASIGLFIGAITVKFLLEYYGYRPFQNLLYGTHQNYGFDYILGLSLASDGKIFILSMALYYLTRTKSAEKELLLARNEKLEAEQKKLEAEVAYLKAQINPHFLQNVLNFFYAQALPHSDNLAEGILSLSEIMRYAMDRNEDENGNVWVSKEIDFVRKVIKMNYLRFQGSIFVSLSVKGDDISGLKIIPMVLITLVENALKHGELTSQQWPVQIEADYKEHEKVFSFSVANHIKKGPKELSHGIGLGNTRTRLEWAYGNKATLTTVEENENYMAIVTIKY